MVEPSDFTAVGTGAAANLGALRRKLRAERRRIGPSARRAASAAVAKKLSVLPAFQRASRVAGYWPADGEIDPLPALARAFAAGKACYLPVLCPWRHGHLSFARWWPGARLRRNRFGIPEPITPQREWLAPRMLDLVLVPLVGFDRAGNRLGMGGGYYDRSFGLVGHGCWHRARLVGVAFDSQRIDDLPRRVWDVPLDAVLTARHSHVFRAL